MIPTADDLYKLVVSNMHKGSANTCSMGMEKYTCKASGNATMFDARKMWQKLTLAARIIAAVPNPEDVCVISKNEIGHRALLKFSHYTGSTSITGRFSPGTFTNHSQQGFREPAVIVVANPHDDIQAIRESSFVGIPVIAMCDADSSLRNIDCAIPCNNKGINAIGTTWWFLAREVLRLRGSEPRNTEWEVMPDLFFFRDPEAIKKQEDEEQAQVIEAEVKDDDNNVVDDFQQGNWEQAGETAFDSGLNQNADWATEGTTKAAGADDNWGTDTAPPVSDWTVTDA
jgi:small subunit ribosomal protein SAe